MYVSRFNYEFRFKFGCISMDFFSHYQKLPKYDKVTLTTQRTNQIIPQWQKCAQFLGMKSAHFTRQVAYYNT
jgi:hypothetical protein